MHPDMQMMEFIYHELDERAEQQFRDHVDGCSRCVAELASLEQTLVTVRAVPAAEPSPAITTRLLHEAARRAPKPASRGLWSRFLEWASSIDHHPALAAAASLLFVGGVVGYLTFTGRADETMRVEEPGVTLELVPGAAPTLEPEVAANNEDQALSDHGVDLRERQAPVGDKSKPTADTRVGRLAPWELKEGAKAGRGRIEQITGKPGYNAKPKDPVRFADKLDRGGVAPTPSSHRNQRSSGKKGGTGKRAKDFKSTQGAFAPNASADSADYADVTRVTTAVEKQAPDQRDAPVGSKNAPVAESAVVGSTVARAPAQKARKSKNKKAKVQAKSEAPTKKSRQRIEAERLHKKAAVAARKSNCAAMKRHMKAIARQDSSYYKSRVVKDRRLDRCLEKGSRSKRKRSSAPRDAESDQAPAAEEAEQQAPAGAE